MTIERNTEAENAALRSEVEDRSPPAVHFPLPYWCEQWERYRCSGCHQAIDGPHACEGGENCAWVRSSVDALPVEAFASSAPAAAENRNPYLPTVPDWLNLPFPSVCPACKGDGAPCEVCKPGSVREVEKRAARIEGLKEAADIIRAERMRGRNRSSKSASATQMRYDEDAIRARIEELERETP